nr:hypothetical protein [Tanacetum cinerariifolium]
MVAAGVGGGYGGEAAIVMMVRLVAVAWRGDGDAAVMGGGVVEMVVRSHGGGGCVDMVWWLGGCECGGRLWFMNYLEEKMDGEAMINSIKNGDQPLPRVTQIDRLERSLLIQGLPNDIYSLIDNNKTAKDLWDALAICLVLNMVNKIGKLQFCMSDVNDAMKSKKKAVVITSDPLALVVEQKKVSKRKEKVVVSSESEESDDELKKINALLAKAFNRNKFYSKPTNNNLRTSSATFSVNKKQKYVKYDDKKEENKVDEKKRA